MGDLPGGAILVQASEGKDVVLRQGRARIAHLVDRFLYMAGEKM